MDYNKVFISYSSKDRTLIQPIIESLSLILNPCISEDKNKAGEPLNEKVKADIESSNVVVPFLTSNSTSSPWVNQELGYALRWRLQNDGEPLILPVCEEGFQPSGFITKKDTEMIPLFGTDVDETTYRLIARLREYIDRNWTIIEEVQVLCENCHNLFKIDIPKQKVVESAVRLKKVVPAYHGTCGTQNTLDPRTFKVVQYARLANPKDADMVHSVKSGNRSGA